jgi:hypothetical protein
MSQNESSANATEAEGSMSNPSPPSEVSWIRKGLSLNVVDGSKDSTYTAKAISDPFFSDDSWEVQVRYDIAGTRVVVDCSKCSPIVYTQRRQAHIKAKVKMEESKAFKTKKTHVVPVVVDLSVESDDDLVDPVRPLPLSEGKKKASASDGDTTTRERRKFLFAPEDNLRVSPVADKPPSDVDYDASSDSSFPGLCKLVSPGPSKRARRGSADEMFVTSSSEQHFPTTETYDGSSENDKKPAARDGAGCDLQFEKAKKRLETLCQFSSPEEVEAALRAIGPPYVKIQAAVSDLNERRAAKERLGNDAWGPFRVIVGMEIRKPFDGTEHTGFVSHEVDNPIRNEDGELVTVWKVNYDDGDSEELEEDELLRYRFPRPNISRCCGRALQSLELFAGT